jgi:hypothetical protein
MIRRNNPTNPSSSAAPEQLLFGMVEIFTTPNQDTQFSSDAVKAITLL